MAVALLLAAQVGAVELEAELRLRAEIYPNAPGGGDATRVLARVAGRGTWLGAAVRVEGRIRDSRTGWRNGNVAELGDTYLTWAGDWGSFRLGHQQVAWGRADAFRLLDRVNPWRLPDALFDDLEEARLPLWMANLELPVAELEWQFLAGWDDQLNSFDPGFPPPSALGDGNTRLDQPTGFAGARVGALLGDLSISLHLLDQPNHDPLSWTQADGRRDFLERRERMLGISADWPMGPLVARFEATASRSTTLDSRLRRVSQNKSQALIGLDWQSGNWLISPQIYYENREPPDYDFGPESRNFISMLVRHRSLQDQLEVRAFATYGLDDTESWLSLRVAYAVNDHFELRLHGDHFNSFLGGLFGPFADFSRVGLETVFRY